MLAHSFDRFYVVTKFILPSITDLKFSKLNYDSTCSYLNEKNSHDAETKKYTLDLLAFCVKIKPQMEYYEKQIKYYNKTKHEILNNEINLILPQLAVKQKCGIVTTLLSNFVGLAYEGISSFLHNKRQKVLQSTVKVINNRASIQCNKPIHLENSMVMYGICNADTLEHLIQTVHCKQNATNSHERLFTGQGSTATINLNMQTCKVYKTTPLIHFYT